MLYAGALTILAAVVAGVMPALKITRGLGASLKEGTAGGGGVRFQRRMDGGHRRAGCDDSRVPRGGCIRTEPGSSRPDVPRGIRGRGVRCGATRHGHGECVRGHPSAAARAARDAQRARFGATLEALRQRMTAEPGVAGVTFVDALPRTWHDHYRMEVDDADLVPGRRLPSRRRRRRTRCRW